MLERLAALGAIELTDGGASRTRLRANPEPVPGPITGRGRAGPDAPAREDLGVLRRQALARKLSARTPERRQRRLRPPPRGSRRRPAHLGGPRGPHEQAANEARLAQLRPAASSRNERARRKTFAGDQRAPDGRVGRAGRCQVQATCSEAIRPRSRRARRRLLEQALEGLRGAAGPAPAPLGGGAGAAAVALAYVPELPASAWGAARRIPPSPEHPAGLAAAR